MFGIGAPELIFILILALLIFGPKRLPQLSRTLGKGVAEFRRASTELQRAIHTEIEEPPAARRPVWSAPPEERRPAAPPAAEPPEPAADPEVAAQLAAFAEAAGADVDAAPDPERPGATEPGDAEPRPASTTPTSWG